MISVGTKSSHALPQGVQKMKDRFSFFNPVGRNTVLESAAVSGESPGKFGDNTNDGCEE